MKNIKIILFLMVLGFYTPYSQAQSIIGTWRKSVDESINLLSEEERKEIKSSPDFNKMKEWEERYFITFKEDKTAVGQADGKSVKFKWKWNDDKKSVILTNPNINEDKKPLIIKIIDLSENKLILMTNLENVPFVFIREE